MPDEKIDQKRPAHAENELKKMQQRLVDDTVDDSFPASDPPAWTTTGAKSIAARCDPDDPGKESDAGADRSSGADQNSVQGMAGQATAFAQEAFQRGKRYVRESGLPEAERYYREGRRLVTERVDAYPLSALVLAGAVGFGLAWFIFGRAATGSTTSARYPAYGHRPNPNRGWRGPDRREHAQSVGNVAASRYRSEVANTANNSF